MGMVEWLCLACDASVVRRALGYAVVVGAILIAINHGAAILNGELALDRLIQMGLTVVVPYLVSTFSSVGVMRRVQASDRSHVPRSPP